MKVSIWGAGVSHLGAARNAALGGTMMRQNKCHDLLPVRGASGSMDIHQASAKHQAQREALGTQQRSK